MVYVTCIYLKIKVFETVVSGFYLHKNELVLHDLDEGRRLWVTE